MSFEIDIKNLDYKTKKKIADDLKIEFKENKYGKKPEFYLYKLDNTKLSVPYAYGYQFLNKNKEDNEILNFNEEENDKEFICILNNIQNEIKEQTLEILNNTGSILISLGCGMGKTIFTIYLSSILRKCNEKVLVAMNRINLLYQWEYSIKKTYKNVKVQILNTKSKIDNSVDFYLININNISKYDDKYFSNISILVIDECHTICTENLSKNLLYFKPKYLIGLSATPERPDGSHYILERFFGPNIISKYIYRLFNVYVVNTNFTPKMEKNRNGDLDWNGVLESQAKNIDRNNLIVKILILFKHRNFIVLCKRKEQTYLLYNLLKNIGEDVDIFVASAKTFNYDCRILLSSFSKTGVGFDHPKLDSLILASDVEEGIEQYIGRVFRKQDTSPIIFDLLDNSRIMKKHFETRMSYYKSIGGQIKYFNQYF